jgi:murein DD-endopeptidase MepM/ murein hydrolase activator NlpD
MTELDDAVKSEITGILADLDALSARMQRIMWRLYGMDGNGGKPGRVLFCAPTNGQINTGANVLGDDWFDATPYAKLYTSGSGQAYHTGGDFNRPAYADSKAAVYAAADGLVNFAGVVKGWQGSVVVIKHVLESGALIWTRYAHIDSLYVQVGDHVERGFKIGHIADYTPSGPAGDHLHFDVAYKDIGATPGDWPGMDLTRLKRDYIDPIMWLKARAV